MATGNPDSREVAARLLAWMAGARRDLPWRRQRDPYAVWISEVMLQQTQAATVIPYYERWMERFPDMEALAAAHLDAVLKAWEGLGYYARARNLHRAAQMVIEHHDGRLPASRKALLALPGVGRYTAGAILSLAYGKPEPVLDGNVRRVLCRLLDFDGDPRSPAIERRLWHIAEDLARSAPEGRAGELNEALMELGALVCTPSAPACGGCPLGELCLARERGTQGERPATVRRRPSPHYDVLAAVIEDPAGRYLIIRRPPNGLLGGLWGFPGGPVQPGETLQDAAVRTVREQVGVEVRPAAALARIRHAYTHFRITLHAYRCELASGEPRPLGCADLRWAPAAALPSYAFPVTDRRIASSLEVDAPRA